MIIPKRSENPVEKRKSSAPKPKAWLYAVVVCLCTVLSKVLFRLKITGQKTKSFTGFNRRSCQNDSAHLFCFKGSYSESYREIGFTCSCRTYADSYRIVFYCFNIIFYFPRKWWFTTFSISR